eukprot:scaffold4840_cov113-Alexandrium_tamarense.AAC.2
MNFDLHERAKRRRILVGYTSANATIATSVLSSSGKALSNHRGRVPGAKTIKRERLDVAQSCHDMNDRHFGRRYRMDKESFWILLDIIEPHLPSTGEMDAVHKSFQLDINFPTSHEAQIELAQEFRSKSTIGL